MEANDSVPVQSSKLSPHVKPFVPRRMQSEYQGPPRYTSYSLIPCYQHDHPAHYVPFIGGVFPFQDYHTGFGLYPCPVYMIEEIPPSPSGTYVSPGTFVCPRGSIQPQRRQLPKYKVPQGLLKFSPADSDHLEQHNTTSLRNGQKEDVHEADCVSCTAVDCVLPENCQKLTFKITDDKQAVNNEMLNRESPKRVSKFKSNEFQKGSKQRNNSSETKSTRENTVNEKSYNRNNSEFPSYKNKKIQTTLKEASQESSVPKQKSFADIMKQSSSSSHNHKVTSNGHSREECDEDTVIKEIVKTEAKSSNELDSARNNKRDQPQLNKMLEQRQRIKNVSGGKPVALQREKSGQPTTFHDNSFKAKSDCKNSDIAESNATLHSNKPILRKSLSKEERGQDIPKRLSLEKSDSIDKSVSFQVNGYENGAISDNDSWIEVRNSRRSKDSKQIRKRINNVNVSHEPLSEKQMSSVQIREPTSQDCVTAVRNAKSKNYKRDDNNSALALCNSKTVKNSENSVTKTRCARKSETTKTPVISNDNSDNKDNESVLATKKKRKTAGQLKKEFQNKVQSLPTTNGRVTTVTHELYERLKPISPLTNNMENSNNVKEKKLRVKEFPPLGSGRKHVNGTVDNKGAFSTKSFCTEDTDDSWSDVELADVKNCVKNQKKGLQRSSTQDEFPELRSLIQPITSTDTSFSSLLKKNYWSLPPRITPINESSTNSATFLEKLLAETARQKDDLPKTESTNTINFVDGAPSNSKWVGLSLPNTKNIRRERKSTSLVEYTVSIEKPKKRNRYRRYLGKRQCRVTAKIARVRRGKPRINYVANILDSTAPRRRRGKERETPRKRRASAIKRIIVKERKEKRLLQAAKENSANVFINNDVDFLGQLLEDVESTCALVATCDTKEVACKRLLHSRKFREYCNHLLTPEINTVAEKLIRDLMQFHDKLYRKDPIKASARRRMVCGFREVCKNLKLKKIRCLILAPNVEKIKSAGGLDDAMSSVITLAEEQRVPYTFALGRKQLGKICLKKSPISCVGIFCYDGSLDNFRTLCQLTTAARASYEQKLDEIMKRFSDSADNESSIAS